MPCGYRAPKGTYPVEYSDERSVVTMLHVGLADFVRLKYVCGARTWAFSLGGHPRVAVHGGPWSVGRGYVPATFRMDDGHFVVVSTAGGTSSYAVALL